MKGSEGKVEASDEDVRTRIFEMYEAARDRNGIDQRVELKINLIYGNEGR